MCTFNNDEKMDFTGILWLEIHILVQETHIWNAVKDLMSD